MEDESILAELRSEYPDIVSELYPFPEPYWGTRRIKAIILGADPTHAPNGQPPRVFNMVFGLDNPKSPYFRSIKKNINQVAGLSMQDIYVQNLCRNYFKQETSKNKRWVEIARKYWTFYTGSELFLMVPDQVPVLVTSEAIFKACSRNGNVEKAEKIYSDCLYIPATESLLGRDMYAFYRHSKYQLDKWDTYRKFISKKIDSVYPKRPTYWEKWFKTKKLKAIGNDKLMSTAYHEAGHVFIYLLYGLSFDGASIIPNEKNNSLGHVKNPQGLKEHDWEMDSLLEKIKDIDVSAASLKEYYCLMAFSGIIAEAFYCGKYNWICSRGDICSLEKSLRDEGFYRGNMQPYWDKTFELVKENIELVTKIANDLYKEKTLGKEYFDKLMPLLEEKRIEFKERPNWFLPYVWGPGTPSDFSWSSIQNMDISDNVASPDPVKK